MNKGYKLSHWLGQLKESLVHFIYPRHCLHCNMLIGPTDPLFCQFCAELLELIDPKERCITCFGLIEKENTPCSICVKKVSVLDRMAAAFDYIGPAASLIKKLKYANQPYLASGAAAFLAAQFERLNWPFPDVLIPVPLSFTHWLDRGYNQSALLAEYLAQFLQVPIDHVLTRKSGDYSQAGLTLEQRQGLEGKSFKMRQGFDVQDKTLLLIDDVTTTGSTLKKCAETLLEGCPAHIYALTFCRALK
jgi:ComF family protein